MAENFQDNISYGGSTLAVSGDAIAVGSTNAGAKSIIFNNTGSQGHLAWQPTNNITINLPNSNGTVQLIGQVPGAIQAGTQTATSGTIVFSNSNGISFGMSNSSVITGSYTVPSTAGLISNINVSAGTTSNNLTAITFSNGNGVSFGLNASTITASVANQTNQTVGLYAVSNTTGQSSSSTFDARSISFQGAGIASVGYSNGSVIVSVPSGGGGITYINVSAGTTSNNLSALTFSNSNSMSFGLNGSVVTASFSQTNQSVGLYAVSNTTQNSSTTLDARTLSFQGAGNVSVGYSNGSIVVSGGGGGGGSVNISAGTTSNNLTNFVLSNSNNVSFGLNGSTLTASFNGTLGSVVFSNQNNIYFGSAGSTTITASVGAIYSFEPYSINNSNTTVLSCNTNTSGAASFIPIVIPTPVAAGWLNMIQSMSFVTNGTSSGQQTLQMSYGLYTRGTGTNSTTFGSITSGSCSFGVTGNNSTYTINQPTTSNNTGYGTGSTTSAGVNITSGYTGVKLIQFPINSTLSLGNYWLGIYQKVSTSSINVGISNSFIGFALSANIIGQLAPVGSFSSAFTGTNQPSGIGGPWYLGIGSYSSAAQTNLPASVAISAITGSDFSIIPYMKFVSVLT